MLIRFTLRRFLIERLFLVWVLCDSRGLEGDEDSVV